MAIDPEKLPSMKRTPTPGEAGGNEAVEQSTAMPQPAGVEPAEPVGRMGGSPVAVPDFGRAAMDGRDLVINGVIALFLGLFFAAAGGTFFRWLATTATGGTFSTGVEWTPGGPKTGEVSYFELQGGTAYGDLGLAAVGASLVVFGIVALVLARRPMPGLLKAALVLVGVATAVCLLTVIVLFGKGITPLMSLIAAAVGAMTIAFSWPGRPAA